MFTLSLKPKFGNFTLSFGRLGQRIELNCGLHVQHDYFSSFNQLEHCFQASSLPLPSALLKLPINIKLPITTCHIPHMEHRDGVSVLENFGFLEIKALENKHIHFFPRGQT